MTVWLNSALIFFGALLLLATAVMLMLGLLPAVHIPAGFIGSLAMSTGFAGYVGAGS